MEVEDLKTFDLSAQKHQGKQCPGSVRETPDSSPQLSSIRSASRWQVRWEDLAGVGMCGHSDRPVTPEAGFGPVDPADFP